MTREEAIKLLEHIGIAYTPTDAYGDYDDPQPYEEALDMAIEALSEPTCKNCTDIISREDAKSVRSRCEVDAKWIPCSERLPDIEQDVLATTTLFDIREVTFAWRINDGKWFIREGSVEATNNDILAWMPLPEPYKAESEVEE